MHTLNIARLKDDAKSALDAYRASDRAWTADDDTTIMLADSKTRVISTATRMLDELIEAARNHGWIDNEATEHGYRFITDSKPEKDIVSGRQQGIVASMRLEYKRTEPPLKEVIAWEPEQFASRKTFQYGKVEVLGAHDILALVAEQEGFVDEIVNDVLSVAPRREAPMTDCHPIFGPAPIPSFNSRRYRTCQILLDEQDTTLPLACLGGEDAIGSSYWMRLHIEAQLALHAVEEAITPKSLHDAAKRLFMIADFTHHCIIEDILTQTRGAGMIGEQRRLCHNMNNDPVPARYVWYPDMFRGGGADVRDNDIQPHFTFGAFDIVRLLACSILKDLVTTDFILLHRSGTSSCI